MQDHPRCDTRCQQSTVDTLAPPRQAKAAKGKKQEKQNDYSTADKTQLFTENSNDRIGKGKRQIARLLTTRTQTQTEPTTRTQTQQRLIELQVNISNMLKRVYKTYQALEAVAFKRLCCKNQNSPDHS